MLRKIKMRRIVLAATLSLLPLGAVAQGINNPGPCTAFGTTAGTCLQGPVALSTLASQATNTVVGNVTGGAATPTAITRENIQYIIGMNSITVILPNVDFNSANTDNIIPITLPTGYTRYLPSVARIVGASASLSTATIGIFDQAGGAGTQVSASGTVITVTSTSDNTPNNAMVIQPITPTVQTRTVATYPNLYFRVQTPQGSPATATVTYTFVPVP
jgi:hypothetical protein